MKAYKKLLLPVLLSLSLFLCGCSRIEAASNEYPISGNEHVAEIIEYNETESSVSRIDGIISHSSETVIFSSWQEAAESLDLDFSLCAADSAQVALSDYISDDYNFIQSYFPPINGELKGIVIYEPNTSETSESEYSEPVLSTITVFTGKNSTASEEELHGYREDFESLAPDDLYVVSKSQPFKTAELTAGDTKVKLEFYRDDSQNNFFIVEAIYNNCLFQMTYTDISEDFINESVDDVRRSLTEAVS